MTINLTPTHCTLPVNVAKALLGFASKDKTRHQFRSIGLVKNEEGTSIAACDGYSSVRFKVSKDDGGFHLRLWSRAYVEQQTKIASAKKQDVELEVGFFEAELKFPDLDAVHTVYKIEFTETVKIDASYLKKMELVTKACEVSNVELVALNAPDLPLVFDVKGEELTARVVIMPDR